MSIHSKRDKKAVLPARVSRRNFLALLASSGTAAALGAYAPGVVRATSTTPHGSSTTASNKLTPQEALKELLDGNKRFVAAKAEHPDQTADRRTEVAQGQHPIAIILSCSDSRVPPEILFDQGLGDLFVMRTAGNVLDNAVLGSIEYGAAELQIPLLVVLGHERCGAVKATVEGHPVPGHIDYIVKAIKPALDSVKDQAGDTLDNTVKANALMVADQLAAAEPILSEAVKSGKLMIVAARYDLDAGEVEILTK
jgi:carbonic anhydrase